MELLTELSAEAGHQRGKVIRPRREYRSNRVGNAFRRAAQSLVRRESYLGASYRYLRAKWGD